MILDYIRRSPPVAPADLANPAPISNLRHYRGSANEERSRHSYRPINPDEPVAYTRLLAGYQGPVDELNFIPQTGTAFDIIDCGYDQIGSTPALTGITIALIILCSYFSGGLTGLLFHREWSRYARLGLWNVTTIIGVRLRMNRYPEIRYRRLFLISFSLLFLALTYLATSLLVVSTGAA